MGVRNNPYLTAGDGANVKNYCVAPPHRKEIVEFRNFRPKLAVPPMDHLNIGSHSIHHNAAMQGR